MIRDDLEVYLDMAGLVQDRPQFWLSGNGLCFTAEAALTMEQNGESPLKILGGVHNCMIERGLYMRHPDPRGFRSDVESIDDYTGLALISLYTNPSLAQEILAYGRTHFWKCGPFKFRYFWENGEKAGTNDVRAFLGRFPSLIYVLQLAAGEKPTFLDRFYLGGLWSGLWSLSNMLIGISWASIAVWLAVEVIIFYGWRKVWFALSVALTNVKDDNQCRLMRLMLRVHDGKTWLGRLAEKRFRKRFVAQWSSGGTEANGWKLLYDGYFQHAHPISKATQ